MSLLKQVYGTSKEGKNNFRVEVSSLIFNLLVYPTPVHLVADSVSAAPTE